MINVIAHATYATNVTNAFCTVICNTICNRTGQILIKPEPNQKKKQFLKVHKTKCLPAKDKCYGQQVAQVTQGYILCSIPNIWTTPGLHFRALWHLTLADSRPLVGSLEFITYWLRKGMGTCQKYLIQYVKTSPLPLKII